MTNAKESPPVCVHILRHGRALCGLEGEPREWAKGHRWIGFGERVDEGVPMCTHCVLAAMDESPPITLRELLRAPEGDTRPLCEVLPATPEFWEGFRQLCMEQVNRQARVNALRDLCRHEPEGMAERYVRAVEALRAIAEFRHTRECGKHDGNVCHCYERSEGDMAREALEALGERL